MRGKEAGRETWKREICRGWKEEKGGKEGVTKEESDEQINRNGRERRRNREAGARATGDF